MTERFPTHPLFTVRTDALAGRSEEQAKLRAAVEALRNPTDETRLFYIAGVGGMGKTRLLEWVRDDLVPEFAEQKPRILCTNIIDFYSSHLRINLDLIETIAHDIREGAGEEYAEFFHDHDDLLSKFRSQRNEAVPDDIRRKVMAAFATAWKEMAKKGFRLLVLLDTAELLRFHDDPVRKRFDAPLPRAAARKWLQDSVRDNDLPGVLFVAAGRRREAPELYEQFCELAGRQERIIDLGGFSLKGVEEYLQYLAETLRRRGYDFEAQKLSAEDDFDFGLANVFHQLTNGLPIALAIALQSYLDQTPPDLMRQIDSLLDGNAAPPDVQEVVQAAFIDALSAYAFGQDASIIVRYMALARRGLTPDRFRSMWQDQSQDQSQNQYKFRALDDNFEQLQEQIFIKTRPDGSLVLHDEVADWLENGFYSADPVSTAAIFERLVEQYGREIDEAERVIARLNRRMPASSEAVIEDDATSTMEATAFLQPETEQQKAEREMLFDAREQRRHLTADRMSYALRWKPLEGYKYYYELAEEIFSTGLREFEAHVRSVFLEWWDAQKTDSDEYRYRDDAAKAGLTQELIDGDFALRAVQRAYTEPGLPADRMGATIRLAERILSDGNFHIPRHTQALLRAYIGLCQGQLEGEATLEDVRRGFEDCMEILDEERGAHGAWDKDLQGWLVHAARAFSYYAYGFFERARGQFGPAVRYYTASLKPYRDLRFEVSQARSLNDKAYVLALVGDSVNAEAAVRDALTLRQRLGYGYPIALSLNTYGIVLMMNERPVSAENYCRRALASFRRLDSRYGQMLAYRALSEAYRRDAERLPVSWGHYLRHLESAREASMQSHAIAEDILPKPSSLLADILDEYGCVYRDLARFCWQNPDECEKNHDAEKNYHEAERLLKESIAAVGDVEASDRRVDSAINLAYLYFWRRYSAPGSASNKNHRELLQAYFDQAEDQLQKAIGYVPEQYRDPAHKLHPKKGELTSYWAHLNKAWSLAALVAQERRLLAERVGGLSEDERTRLENELAGAVIRVLYFADRLPGDVRAVRRARHVVYEVLKPLASTTLERFYGYGEQVFPLAERVGWEEGVAIFRSYLEDSFGIDEPASAH